VLKCQLGFNIMVNGVVSKGGKRKREREKKKRRLGDRITSGVKVGESKT
jgi:hypothetical protein